MTFIKTGKAKQKQKRMLYIVTALVLISFLISIIAVF